MGDKPLNLKSIYVMDQPADWYVKSVIWQGKFEDKKKNILQLFQQESVSVSEKTNSVWVKFFSCEVWLQIVNFFLNQKKSELLWSFCSSYVVGHKIIFPNISPKHNYWQLTNLGINIGRHISVSTWFAQIQVQDSSQQHILWLVNRLNTTILELMHGWQPN